MDKSDVLAKLMKPWEVTENPATKFAPNNKIEKQLIKPGFADQQKACLAFALSALKGRISYECI